MGHDGEMDVRTFEGVFDSSICLDSSIYKGRFARQHWVLFTNSCLTFITSTISHVAMAGASSLLGAAPFEGLPVPVSYLAGAFALVFLLCLRVSKLVTRTVMPHLNPRKAFEFTDTRVKKHFVVNSRPMLESWFSAHPDQPARVIGDIGEVTVLPHRLANEIRNDPRLSFARWITQVT
jgi:hypothetical protein